MYEKNQRNLSTPQKQELFEQLNVAGIRSTDTVLAHFSMRAFGPFEGGADALIDAFREYLSDGLFCVPTHTWATVNRLHRYFDIRNAVPCIGALPMVAAARDDGVMTCNPTHSMMIFGDRAREYAEADRYISTPTPREGCYGRLIDEDGVILLVGVGHDKNTFLHCLEETAKVPCRLSRRPTPYVVTEQGQKTPHPMRDIRCPYYPDVSRLFPTLDTLLRENGAEITCRIGNADSIACRAAKAAEILLPIMQNAAERDEDYLLSDEYAKYRKTIRYRLFASSAK